MKFRVTQVHSCSAQWLIFFHSVATVGRVQLSTVQLRLEEPTKATVATVGRTYQRNNVHKKLKEKIKKMMPNLFINKILFRIFQRLKKGWVNISGPKRERGCISLIRKILIFIEGYSDTHPNKSEKCKISVMEELLNCSSNNIFHESSKLAAEKGTREGLLGNLNNDYLYVSLSSLINIKQR